MEDSNLSTVIDAGELVPAGMRGEIFVVDVMENDGRKDEDRFSDQTMRPFKVFARLGKTALIAESIEGGVGLEDGESYILVSPDAVAGRVRAGDHMMEIKSNSKGEYSLIEFECAATSINEARSIFQGFAFPFLDHLSYVQNCPVFVQSIRVQDVCNDIRSIDYVSPYRKSFIKQARANVPVEVAPILAIYRDAKNSHSDFYKFLCYHKILDGLLGALRKSVYERARKRRVELIRDRDLVPDDPDIALAYRDYIGKPIGSFYSDVLTPRFRNAIAHFILKDGAILNLSDPSSLAKHSEIMYVSELCVRIMIESHFALLQQLNLH